jgi:hypothetical protein
MSTIHGILGRPYFSLEEHLDLGGLDAVHEEICLGLTRVPVDYTGGSHRTMGIMPPSRTGEALGDYGEAIRAMSRDELVRFRDLADDPGSIDLDALAEGEVELGEERDHPLSRRQMLYLKYRYRVYFPWKVYYEMIPNRRWEDKHVAAGKAFTREAQAIFPKTVAFLKGLPFEAIGRANILGLEAHDHGTVHRDCDPEEGAPPAHFITLCPRGDKRLFLWDETAREKVAVAGRAYWFHDGDYHGVDADPFFRYSIRVDGVFQQDFLAALRETAGPR